MGFDHDVVIVGAGASGIGMAQVLTALGLERFLVVDRHEIGASFRRWPSEMRFITPSFTGNAFGQVDLNAITYNTSPAYTLDEEHPTGRQFAAYLSAVAEQFELRVKTGVDVVSVTPLVEREAGADGTGFRLQTSIGPITSRFVIWAAGEFQYPRSGSFPGHDLCQHNSTVASWRKLVASMCPAPRMSPDGNSDESLLDENNDSLPPWLVIGGAESGIDAAVNLVRLGQRVIVFDSGEPWEAGGSDPSRTLTPYTLRRLDRALATERLELVKRASIGSVTQVDNGYLVVAEILSDAKASDEAESANDVGEEPPTHASSSETWLTPWPPILATGFQGSLSLIQDLFAVSDAGTVLLNEQDESTLTPGLFVTGPMVQHENVIFCFIYKFRQRFAVIGKAIAERLGVDSSVLEEYRQHGMFLDDLSCCEDECAC
jgi:putative flavoprotein involved in K+ transport